CWTLSSSQPRCVQGFTFPRCGMGITCRRIPFHGRNGRTRKGDEVYLSFDAPSRALPNGHSTFQRVLDERRDTFSKLSRRTIHPLAVREHSCRCSRGSNCLPNLLPERLCFQNWNEPDPAIPLQTLVSRRDLLQSLRYGVARRQPRTLQVR